MKSWLKENWFKVGILFAIFGATMSASYYYAFSIQKRQESVANVIVSQESITSTSTSPKKEYISPFSEILTKNAPIQDAPEDSVLKIERCKSDARIESNLEIGRVKDPLDIEACLSNPQCNLQNFSSLLDNLADSNGRISYDNVYNMCLQTTKELFDNIEQTYDGYWDKCISENPYPTTDPSGIAGMDTYNVQKSCVSKLEVVNGL